MSEIAAPAEGLDSLSAAMASAMVERGTHTQADIDSMIAMDSADASALPAPVAKPAGPKSMQAVMREALASRNLITADEAAADAEREGAGLEPDNEQAPARDGLAIDPEADKLERTMASAFAPPESPAGYDLPPVENFDPNLGAAFRTMAHSTGLDAPLARTIYDEFNAGAAKGELTHEAREAYAVQSRGEVQRMFGDRTEAMLGYANQELARIATAYPKIIDLVTRTDLGNNPNLVVALATRGMARSGSRN